MKLEDLGRVDSADLLIIGGGIAGLVAANAALDESPGINIVVVEKAHVPYGGQANKGRATSTTWPPKTTTTSGWRTTSRR